jgi:hypothetical protein
MTRPGRPMSPSNLLANAGSLAPLRAAATMQARSPRSAPPPPSQGRRSHALATPGRAVGM